jgi:hypothetical protein
VKGVKGLGKEGSGLCERAEMQEGTNWWNFKKNYVYKRVA